ncbi:MAG: AI-2E family transporter [Minicystis sp.]
MDSKSPVSSTVLTLAAAVIVVAGLKFAQPLLAPLLLAALITATCAPIAAWLSARGMPAGVGAGVALLVGVAFLAGCSALIAYSANDARAQLPAYWARAGDVAGSIAASLTRLGIDASREKLLSIFEAGRMMSALGSTLTAAADVLPHLVVMPLLVFFALAEVAGFGDKLRFILPDTSKGLEGIDAAVREVQKYLLVKTATSLVGAVLVGLLLVVFKVDFAVLLAVLFFLLHFIPNLGSAVATVPGVAMALLQHGPGSAVGVLAGYLVINAIVGNIIEPKVMGRTLGLSPLVVLLAMVFWGWLWGPIGALVSVPLTMIAKIVFENSKDLGWLAVLIGPSEALPAPEGRPTLIPSVLLPLIPRPLIPLIPLVRPGAPIGLGAGPNAIKRAATIGPRSSRTPPGITS